MEEKGGGKREKEGERSGDRRQGWVWAERKHWRTGRPGSNSIYRNFSHSLPGLSRRVVPNLEIAPLGGEHSGGHFGILYSD